MQQETNFEIYALRHLISNLFSENDEERTKSQNLLMDNIYPWKKKARVQKEADMLNAVTDVITNFQNRQQQGN